MRLLNVVQIYEDDREVIVKRFDMSTNICSYESFDEFENLTEIFPDKAKDLNGSPIFAVYVQGPDAFTSNDQTFCRWTYFLDIIAEKLNSTIIYKEIPLNESSWEAYRETREIWMKKLLSKKKLDFYLNYPNHKWDLQSYNHHSWCFLAPLPKKHSIVELILFMPLDKMCWMWLGSTIAVSTILWRISDGHWNFLFGAFGYLVGKYPVKIRT